jgi:large subunit ribosomal protein L21
MYAIIRAGGKQSKVSEGDIIDVERIKKDGPVSFTPLLIVEKNGTVISDRKELAKAKVTAEVLGESSGPKVDIFKYKAKTGYRRRAGHRQTYTQLKIMKIEKPGGKKAADKSTSDQKPATKKAGDKSTSDKKPATKKAAAKSTTTKKPAAKKPADKSTAAKKPAAKKPKEGS